MFLIRPAQAGDLPELLRVYAAARDYMRRSGNPGQWGTSHPPASLVEEDLRLGRSFAGVGEDGRVHGVFACYEAREPAYLTLQGGAWLFGERCRVIHRVASDGAFPGFFAACAAFCRGFGLPLRIDTHRDNLPMQRALEREGFLLRGTVTLADGGERLAYEYSSLANSPDTGYNKLKSE